jgi:hypothetical protein
MSRKSDTLGQGKAKVESSGGRNRHGGAVCRAMRNGNGVSGQGKPMSLLLAGRGRARGRWPECKLVAATVPFGKDLFFRRGKTCISSSSFHLLTL